MKLSVLGACACSLGVLAACSSNSDSGFAVPGAAAGGTTATGTEAAGTGGTPTVIDEDGPMPGELDGATATGTAVPESNTADVEDRGSGCSVPPLPTYDQLAENPMLPDPFLSMDGARISTKAAWTCRREEISAAVQQFELGPKPPKPANVSGALSGNVFTVSVDDGGPSISFNATINLPPTGTAPYPAVIVLGNGTSLDDNATLSGRGVALILLEHDTIALQESASSRGTGKFYDLYGAQHEAGAMMAWAWGTSRLIDALERAPETSIDPKRLGVTGCSRNGKGALVVGAFDERIALTLQQESGAGGSSLWRMADAHQQAWIDAGMLPDYGAVQTLAEIVGENDWFRTSFAQFSQTSEKLPFDQHTIMGMVAPRALYVLNNTDQYWLDREGSHFGARMAHRVFEALQLPGSMGESQMGGHPHCGQVPQAELDEVGAYADKFLIGGGTAATGALYTDGGFADPDADWVDWTAPTLQ